GAPLPGFVSPFAARYAGNVPKKPRLPPRRPATVKSGIVAVALTLGLLGVQDPQAGSQHRVRDDVGRQVVVPAYPRRIVSLAPSVTQMLFALGAGDRVVGVTDQCDDPAAARSRPRVGGMVKPDWESVVRLRPDLIVASTAGNDASLVSQSEELG